MKTLALLAVAACSATAFAQQPSQGDIARWNREAANVTITRDDWGIAHIHGKTDADVIFGMEYAQAEDDFNRVETNYINAMGRLAEAEGEPEVYRDLRMKLFINPDSLKAYYQGSPEFLKKLMDSFADGLNFYLYKHPQVKPRVIARFEPWMALSYTEGSIGGDIEKVNLTQLQSFYPALADAKAATNGRYDLDQTLEDPDLYVEPTGSNGIAISPSNEANHRALLYINPHTSFFFRSELQCTSDEGLNAYGAVTWGQIFIYQGFNDRIGWMHTSSGVDAVDEFLETVTKQGDGYVYKHGNDELPVSTSHITVPFKTATGMAKRHFTVYYTQHGPVVRAQGDKWVSISLMNSPVKALTQSYTRTKARSYADFAKSFDLHTNSSNNTIYADADGNIAYWHGNYIPRRDNKFDWTKPVDGSDPATDYRGLLSVDETPKLFNPASGFIYNSNNWPWSASGPSSPKRADFPAYVEMGREESPRGYHALRVLSDKTDFTRESLIAAGYDSYLPAFARMIPSLVKAYDALPAADPLKTKVADQIAQLRGWDYRWGVTSVPTSLAVFWGEDVGRRVGQDARRAGKSPEWFIADGDANGQVLVQSLASASDKLAADFGKWNTPWGDINRFQRINDDIASHFDDNGPSIPVGFVSSRWGSLASFGARAYANTKKWYGTSGNSFIAAIEFGKDSVRARAITAGGESGDPSSKHFDDEATRYATGDLRTVYYYPSQLAGHTERVYHPGN